MARKSDQGGGVGGYSKARLSYCEATMAALDDVNLPTPCPAFRKWIEESAGQSRWRCNQARQHECSLALGLATDPTTCCSKRRIRYLRPNDAPHLLRIKDVAAEGCEAQIEAYACAERPGVRRKGVKCGPVSSLGVSRPLL